MQCEGRLQSGLYDGDRRSTFGLPNLLQELFRIALPCQNLDQKSGHFVSVVELVHDLGWDVKDFPEIEAAAYIRAAFISCLQRDIRFSNWTADDLKTLLISIAYQCQLRTDWPEPLVRLHQRIECVVEANARLYPDRVECAKLWGKKRP